MPTPATITRFGIYLTPSRRNGGIVSSDAAQIAPLIRRGRDVHRDRTARQTTLQSRVSSCHLGWVTRLGRSCAGPGRDQLASEMPDTFASRNSELPGYPATKPAGHGLFRRRFPGSDSSIELIAAAE